MNIVKSKALLFGILVALSTHASAKEAIEVFINQGTTIDAASQKAAQEKNYVFNYYYIDSLKLYEKKITEDLNKKFKHYLSIARKNKGFVSLPKKEQEEVLVALFENNNGNLEAYGKKMVTPKDVLAIQQSFSVAKIAKDKGITSADLPAFILDGKVYKKSLDIKSALTGKH